MVEILIAIALGFCAGIFGALVTNEFLIEKVEKEMSLNKKKYQELEQTAEGLKEHDTLEDIAMQRLIIQFKKERGAIWESLNGLWVDYDKRNKREDPVEQAEKEETEND